MSGNGVDVKAVQKKAIDQLTEGKTKFTSAKNKDDMKEGYNMFYGGIELLTQLQQYERHNQYAYKQIGDKIKEYVNELKAMKGQLESAKFDKPKRPTGGSQSGGNNNNDEGSDDEDPEKKKFRDQLSQAIVMEKPTVTWDDVAGLEMAKNTLKESILLPRKFPDIFQGIRTPWKGILQYGPPGTGKTFLAKACANMADATFFSISSSDLVSKWVGESEKLIKALFALAREKAPSIIFIDEIDSLVQARSDNEGEASRRVKTEFLVQMQGVNNDKPGDLLVLGATNFPWGLDPAMRRRFEKRVYISLPDFESIYYKLKRDLSNLETDVTEQQLVDIAHKLDGYSMSDITSFIKQAAMAPLTITRQATHFKQVPRDGKMKWQACSATDQGATQARMDRLPPEDLIPPPISFMNFITALEKAKPAVTKEDLIKQEEFTREFGMEG